MSFLAGRFGGLAGNRSLLFTSHSTDIMPIPRNNENGGALPHSTNKLARWVQKKHAGRRGPEPVTLRTGSGTHLLKNGQKQSYFNYTAYEKFISAGAQPTTAKPENGRAVEREERPLLFRRRRSSKGKSPEVEERTPPPSRESQPPQHALSRARQAVEVLKADRARVVSRLGDLGGGPAVAMVGL